MDQFPKLIEAIREDADNRWLRVLTVIYIAPYVVRQVLRWINEAIDEVEKLVIKCRPYVTYVFSRGSSALRSSAAVATAAVGYFATSIPKVAVVVAVFAVSVTVANVSVPREVTRQAALIEQLCALPHKTPHIASPLLYEVDLSPELMEHIKEECLELLEEPKDEG